MSFEKVDLPGNSWYKFYKKIPKDLRLDTDGFENLWDEHPLAYGKVVIYGRELDTPRWQQPYGRDYSFSHSEHKSKPIEHPHLVKILEWVKKDSGLPYNGILLNWYSSGEHHIGKHSDDERQLVRQTPIYSFSYGQERDFIISSKPKTEYQLEDNIKVSLPNNSLIIMGGEMQSHYHHSVPKRALSKCPDRRINVTVRLFKED
jgi:alkylated DNA repair dioxygenase AlkB